jgi:hypothetical protein
VLTAQETAGETPAPPNRPAKLARSHILPQC